MTKEQREQAEAWSKHLEWLYEGKLEAEIAALLRAGIAASEECELRGETITRLAGMLYDEQIRRMRQPECADIRDILRRLSAEDISNGKAAELILDFVAGAAAQAWLAAWDAEWRAQDWKRLHGELFRAAMIVGGRR